MTEQHVRILIPADDPDLHDERVWAVPHATIPNVYRVDNVPLSPCGIAYHDWVECTRPKRKRGNIPHVLRVYQPSGYGLVMADVDKDLPNRAPLFMAFLDALKDMSWPLESMHDAYWVFLAVPPGQQQTAEALFKTHPQVEANWLIDCLSHDTSKHPATLPAPVSALIDAWTALTTSFKASQYSPHDDLSEETRAALRQLEAFIAPLMKDEDDEDA